MAKAIGEISATLNERPLAYFITFSCYGARLHGAELGSVDKAHNRPGTPLLAPDSGQRAAEMRRMDQTPYGLDSIRRAIVLGAIRKVCAHRKWELLAAHVRTNHVHVVLRANEEPEKVMNALKAYSSRRMNEAGLDTKDRKRWARHGSTRYLWSEDAIEAKVHYTLHEQGELMEAYPHIVEASESEPRSSRD